MVPTKNAGTATKISTSAALTAEIEMSQGQLNITTDAKCPECDAPVKYVMEMDGQISVPCSNEGCETFSVMGQFALDVKKNSHLDLTVKLVTLISHTLILF